jgi:hypothetical protein
MLKFAVSACRIFRPNSGHPPEGLFTEVPGETVRKASGAKSRPQTRCPATARMALLAPFCRLAGLQFDAN